MKSRLPAFLLSLVLCLSLVPPAAAARVPSGVVDAKDELATVDITQICNGTESDYYIHNYATDGSTVTIDYKPTLQMTEEMALYLLPRQSQLMNAKFNVCVEIDTNVLEFDDAGSGRLTVTFKSKFLKPWDVKDGDPTGAPDIFGDYRAAVLYGDFTFDPVVQRDTNGVFTYSISINKAWAENYAAVNGHIDIPMELIVYYDEGARVAYGYEDLFDAGGNVKAAFADKKPLYYNFEKEDWMSPVSARLQMKVRDTIPPTVTYDPTTWKHVKASGTIDGEFTYEKWNDIDTIGDYAYTTDVSRETLEFGNTFATNGNQVIEEWVSNEVEVYLVRWDGGPDSPYLNLDDHFAYIIGYPDGKVHPEGNITRAEVATIFFRMLTDEVRDEYWCKTNPYNDVKLTDWFNNAISTLTNLGVIEGYPDGGFHPQANITRAEFATMAVRFFLITEEYTWDEDAFSDIAGHWANEYINLAYLLEIVDGYPDGTFKPQNVINRAEAMTIVNNTLRRTPCNEGVEPVEEDMITWPDNMNKDKWYYAAVQEATNSHEYTYFMQAELREKELWQEILPVRDWAAFERAWSDAHSAANPGEVVEHD